MAARKLGASWWCDFRFGELRYRKRAPLNTKGGAQAYEVFLRGELARHGSLAHLAPRPTPPTPVTFAEFAERWMRDYVAANNKPSERAAKEWILRLHLMPHFGPMAIGEINSRTVEAYKAAALQRHSRLRGRRGLSLKTINNHLAVLRTCLRTAAAWDEITAAPSVKPLRAPEPRYRYLTRADAASILDAMAPEWRRVAIFALSTGMRFGEIHVIDWSDIDLERGVATVRRAIARGVVGTPKGNRARAIVLPAQLVRDLRTIRRPSGPLFPHIHSHKQAIYALHLACRWAGVEPIGWHVLRHTYASWLVQGSAPIRAIQELLGHRSLTTTMRYAHLDDGTLRRAVGVLDVPTVGADDVWATGGQTERRALDTPRLSRAESAQQSQTTASRAVV